MTYSGETDKFAQIEATLDRISLAIERTQAIQNANAQQIAANCESGAALDLKIESLTKLVAENRDAIAPLTESQKANQAAIAALTESQKANQREHSRFQDAIASLTESQQVNQREHSEFQDAIASLTQSQQANQIEHSEFRRSMQAASENFQTLLNAIS